MRAFTVAFLSVYIIAGAGLLINVDGLSLLLPEWESSVEKPRKRKESLRKYQLQGEKLAKISVVLFFGLYLATSSGAGECLRAVEECSLRAPFGAEKMSLCPLLKERTELQRHRASCQAFQDCISKLGSKPRFPDIRSAARGTLHV